MTTDGQGQTVESRRETAQKVYDVLEEFLAEDRILWYRTEVYVRGTSL